MKYLLTVAGVLAISALALASLASARPASNLEVTPEAIDFGSVAQGGIASQALTVTNTGRGPVVFGGWGVEGGPFTFNDAMCQLVATHNGALLLPHRTCTFIVIAQTFSFPPGGTFFFPPGEYEGAFTVTDLEGGELVDVPLRLTIT
jgi:hypothetical protein